MFDGFWSGIFGGLFAVPLGKWLNKFNYWVVFSVAMLGTHLGLFFFGVYEKGWQFATQAMLKHTLTLPGILVPAGAGVFAVFLALIGSAHNTNLKGAVITSSDQAIADGSNFFKTGTLTQSDIENRARYKASSIGIGGGFASASSSGPGTGVGTDQRGNAATGGQVPGSTLPSTGGNGTGVSATPPIVMSAKGNASSTTRSGIAGGTLIIADDDKQQALTGKNAEQTVASTNRDTKNTENSLAPIFDQQKIDAGFEITSGFIRETGAYVNNRIKEADTKRQAANDTGNGLAPEQRAQLLSEAQQIESNWGPGGTYRQVVTALSAAAGGNVTGSGAQFAQAAVVSYVQQQGADYLGNLVANGTLTEGSPLHAAIHGILACAGAAGSGQSCAAGAAGAAASNLLTNLFTDQPGETNAQKEAKRNLITSLVAGVAGIASSANASTATNAATIAVDNNYLTQQQKQARAEALSECKTPDCQKDIRARYAKLYEENRRRVMNCSTPEECRNIAKELREEQSAQGKRATELIDKAKFGNGLSEAEQMELADLRLADTSINQMRSYAISNAARADGATPLGDTEQQLLAGEIGIGAAAGIGAVQKIGSKNSEAMGGTEIGSKLDYFLGQATGSQHNIDRSQGMLRQLESIGLPDTPTTRQYLSQHLSETYANSASVLRTQDNGRVVRESLLMGPQGGVKFETIWEGNRLITGRMFKEPDGRFIHSPQTGGQ